MNLFRPLLIVSLAVVFSVGAATGRADDAKKETKKNGGHGVHGVVIDVQKDKDKDEGLIVVRVRSKKKGEAAQTAAEEKKFRVNKETKFELVSGRKGERQRKPGTFADVHKGEHVLIVAGGKEGQFAERVAILVRSKQSKKTAAAKP